MYQQGRFDRSWRIERNFGGFVHRGEDHHKWSVGSTIHSRAVCQVGVRTRPDCPVENIQLHARRGQTVAAPLLEVRRCHSRQEAARNDCLHSPPMRHAILLRSVARLLQDGESLVDAAYMWRRHPHMLWYGGAAFALLVAVAAAVGWQEWPARVGFGAAAGAVAVYSTTEYRVLARTSGRPSSSKGRGSVRLPDRLSITTRVRCPSRWSTATCWLLPGISWEPRIRSRRARNVQFG